MNDEELIKLVEFIKYEGLEPFDPENQWEHTGMLLDELAKRDLKYSIEYDSRCTDFTIVDESYGTYNKYGYHGTLLTQIVCSRDPTKAVICKGILEAIRRSKP